MEKYNETERCRNRFHKLTSMPPDLINLFGSKYSKSNKQIYKCCLFVLYVLLQRQMTDQFIFFIDINLF